MIVYNNKINMRKEYFCELCNFKTKLKENFRVHNTTKKHKKKVYEAKEYKCEFCYYIYIIATKFSKTFRNSKA